MFAGDVAMHDALRVRRPVHPRLDADVSTSATATRLRDPLSERLARERLHDDERVSPSWPMS
jgi:hypothetical protein